MNVVIGKEVEDFHLHPLIDECTVDDKAGNDADAPTHGQAGFGAVYKIGFLHLGDGVLLDGFYGFSRRNNLEFFDVGDVEIERDFRIVEIHDYESDKQNYEENENRNGDKYIESQYNSR